MITKEHKLIVRYIMITVLFGYTVHLSQLAYMLEADEKLTMQFAGIVIAAWGVVTLCYKFILQSEAGK